MTVVVTAAEKDELLSSSSSALCRRRRRFLLLLLLLSRSSPLHGQRVQPASAAVAEGPAVGLRGHGEAALGLQEREQLEPERLERELILVFSFQT